MGKENHYGDYLWIEENPDFEGWKENGKEKPAAKWRGYDTGFEILPHLGIDWKDLEHASQESGKPIVDLGASFSSLAIEGVLRDIDIIPVDADYDEKALASYAKKVSDTVRNETRPFKIYRDSYRHQDLSDKIRAKWLVPPRSGVPVSLEGAKSIVRDKCVQANAAKLPFQDRGVAMVIAHDSVPKHSVDAATFVEQELPEILRVTDKAVRIYPLAIYKEVFSWITPEDDEDNPDFKPEPKWQESFKEVHALYKDEEALQRIRDVAEKMGFTFSLEKGGVLKDMPDDRESEPSDKVLEDGPQDQEAMIGVFTRK